MPAAAPTGTHADTPLIEAHNVSLTLGHRLILDDISLSLQAGEIVTLVGLNGSGKSTLTRTLLGLIEPQTGEIRRKPGLKVGYTPQTFPRDPSIPLSVQRFLGLALPRGRAQERKIAAVLAETGVPETARAQLWELSGGELQRVLLARALLKEPDLLVLDEPTANVDVAGQSEIFQLIARLREERNCGVLLVSHDLHLVMASTDRVVCLSGHICCSGKPHAIVQDPHFIDLFGPQLAQDLAVYTHHHDHQHTPHGDIVTGGTEPAGAHDHAAHR